MISPKYAHVVLYARTPTALLTESPVSELLRPARDVIVLQFKHFFVMLSPKSAHVVMYARTPTALLTESPVSEILRPARDVNRCFYKYK